MPKESPDSLRKQIYEELQSQFDSKLRDLKRQKQQAEEELEEASERWRTERRRLNSEIERLEGTLVETRDEARKKTKQDDHPVLVATEPDPAELERIQGEVEEKLRTAEKEWQNERARLSAEVDRLQEAVVQALERSSNPMRAQQAIRDQYEAQILQLRNERNQLEQIYLRSRSDWDQERQNFTLEIDKLKKGGPKLTDAARDALRKQVTDRLRGGQAPPPDAPNPIADALRAERDRMAADVQRLEAALHGAREEGRRSGAEESRKLYEPKFEEAARAQTRYEEEVKSLQKQLDGERARLLGRVSELEKALADAAKTRSGPSAEEDELRTKVAELKRARSAAQDEIESAREKWRIEKADLRSEIDRLELAVSEAATKTAGGPDPALAARLHEAESLVSRLREQSANADRQLQEAQAEAERLRQQILDLESRASAGTSRSDQLERELRDAQAAWHSERDQLTARADRLERALNDSGASGSAAIQEAERRVRDAESGRQQAEQQLRTASAAWDAERARAAQEVSRIVHELEESRKSLAAAQTAAAERVPRLELQQLETRLNEAAAAQKAARDTHAQELGRRDEERQGLLDQIRKLEGSLEDTRRVLSQDADHIKKDFDQKLRDLTSQRSNLEAELKKAGAVEQQFREAESRWKNQSGEMTARAAELEKKLHDAVKTAESHAQRYQTDASSWNQERNQLKAQIGQVEQKVTDARQAMADAVARFEKDLAAAHREQSELKNTAAGLEQKGAEAQRAAAAAIEKAQRDAAAAITAATEQARKESQSAVEKLQKDSVANLERLKNESAAHAEKLQKDAAAQTDKLRRELEQAQQAAASERTQTQAALETARTELNRYQQADKEWQTARAALQSQIQQLEAKLEQVSQQSSASRKEADAELEQVNARFEKKIQALQAEHAQARQADEARQKELGREMAAAQEKWSKEKKEFETKTTQLERAMAESRDSVRPDVVEQLRKQYEEKLKKAIDEKSLLTRELGDASKKLEDERARLAKEIEKAKVDAPRTEPAKAGKAAAAPASNVDSSALEAEVKRIESKIQEIAKLIDDPATELSTVIRKNVEKSELDAYLKGILFSLGKGKAFAK